MDNIKDQTKNKLFSANDMVRADCGGCAGCSSCCSKMGTSVILDPWDICQITHHLKKSFEELVQNELELNIVNGMILPNLKMTGQEENCVFLNGEGRCLIHGYRPGICRLFPLGRQYEDGKLHYFLVQGECQKESRSKIKVKKWLEIPNLNQNEQFVTEWHYLRKHIERILEKETSLEKRKSITMFVLQQFYVKPYASAEEFYQEWGIRLSEAKKALGAELNVCS